MWRKRQTELGLKTVKQYEDIIRALTMQTSVAIQDDLESKNHQEVLSSLWDED